MATNGQAEEGDADDGAELDIFQEPAGYFRPKAPFTFTSFGLRDGRVIDLRLVGESPLWAHHLWNGARALSEYLQQNADTLVKSRFFLELGAAAGLPSLVCAVLGAARVVVTDYPDAEIIENLQYNISKCSNLVGESNVAAKSRITALGYLWGADVTPLVESLPSHQIDQTGPSEADQTDATRRFDTILLADILYNHSEHQKLVRTIHTTLARTAGARALVFFTPYRPWLFDRDLAFFDLVRAFSLSTEGDGEEEDGDVGARSTSRRLGVKKIHEEVLPKAMFENDRGDEMLRRTVFGYEIFWTDLSP